MSEFYDDMRNVAGELFEEFNQGVVKYIAVARAAGARPDAPGAATETPYTVNATARAVMTKYVDRSTVFQTDIQVSFAADTRFTPTLNGFVEIDGERYKVIQIIRNPAAGTTVSYILIVRR